jgi:hypothetical protein
MNQFLYSAMAVALLTCPTTATEPESVGVLKPIKPEPVERPAGDVEFVIPRQMPPRRPIHLRLIDFAECPIRPIVQYLDSPNTSLRRLLDESEDMQRARDHFRRFRLASSQPF